MKRTALISLAAMLMLTACNTANEENSVLTSAETTSEAFTEQTKASETTTAEAVTETSASTTAETSVLTTAEETSVLTAEQITATETVSYASVKEPDCACPTEWQHQYSEYLNSLDFLKGGVYLGDINGDDIPEAVIEINPFEMTDILYFNDIGMQKLELFTISVWGSVRYIPDTRQILFDPMRGHTWGTYGFEEYYLYGWNGSDFEVDEMIYRDAGMYYIDGDGTEHAELGQAYIDGVEVDSDTFKEKLAEYQKLEQDNSYFPVAYICDYDYNKNPDMDSVKNYIKTNFPCFNKWELLEN